MAEPTIAADHLPSSERRRIDRCGVQVYGKTESGEEVDFGLPCRSRVCSSCARRYRQRVYSSILETLRDAEPRDLQMLTLSHRAPESGHSVSALEAAVDDLAERWGKATELARTVARYWRKLEHWQRVATREADSGRERRKARRWTRYYRKALHGAGLACSVGLWDAERPERYVSRWGDGPPPYVRELTYVRALEVTTGDSGSWNAHYHVLCPDRQTAELLNACWQTVRNQADICQTDISSTKADDLADAASYVASYVCQSRSSTVDSDERPECADELAARKHRALADRRLYSAGGRWSPLGIGDHDDPDDPVVAISYGYWKDVGHWESWEVYYSQQSLVRRAINADLLDNREVSDDLPDLESMARARETRVLEQATNNSETENDSRQRKWSQPTLAEQPRAHELTNGG